MRIPNVPMFKTDCPFSHHRPYCSAEAFPRRGRGVYTVCGNSRLGHLDFDHLNLPCDLAQGGESFDLSQDREPVERPVERLVEPFRVSCL